MHYCSMLLFITCLIKSSNYCVYLFGNRARRTLSAPESSDRFPIFVLATRTLCSVGSRRITDANRGPCVPTLLEGERWRPSARSSFSDLVLLRIGNRNGCLQRYDVTCSWIIRFVTRINYAAQLRSVKRHRRNNNDHYHIIVMTDEAYNAADNERLWQRHSLCFLRLGLIISYERIHFNKWSFFQ